MTRQINHILLPGVIDNASLRQIEGFNSQIGGDSRVSEFFSAKEALLTVLAGGSYDGLVSTMDSRKASSAETMAEAVTAAQPSFDRDGGPNGREALRFFTSGSDKMTYTGSFPVAGDFFKAVVFKSSGNTGNEYLLASGTTGNRHILQLGALAGPINDLVIHRVGASGAEALVSLPYTPNEWTIAIGTWNATTKTVGLSINGGAFSFDAEPTAVVDESGVILGFNGLLADRFISDVIWGNVDLSEDANGDLLDVILEYCRNVLAMDV